MTGDARSPRYQRQMTLDGWGNEAQVRLGGASVFVAGAGGLGSAVLAYLCAAGVGTLLICDHDRVELSNLNRQVLHDEESIGKLKTQSAFRRLSRLNQGVCVRQAPVKIVEENVFDLLEGVDLIVDCLDSFEARQILNKGSVRRSIPMVHGGVNGLRGQISFLHPPETACLACFFPEDTHGPPPPVAGCTAGVIGSLQAMEVIKYFTGIGSVLRGRVAFFDGAEMCLECVMIEKNPGCAVCGENGMYPQNGFQLKE